VTNGSIAFARKIALEFIALVDEMNAEEEKRVSSYNANYHYNSPKHRGAVRRKSMDLSRALSAMRKP
jgi:hypothetical protein